MTPGEAAVMKASVTRAPSRAARRLAMSVSTAARSFHSMGPLQAGRATCGAPLRARGRLGKVRPVGAALHRALPAEAGEALAHVGRVADLALLAVVHHVHARVGLLLHDVPGGAAHAGREGGGVGRGARVHRLQHGEEIRGPGEAARVRGEDAVDAALHASSKG
jgi:hypothetical protein